MTISSTTTKVSASGDGSTAAFNYTFKIFADSEMEVIIRSSTGTETTKTLTTHYTVSGAGNDAGGTVTFTGGNIPASGETVVLRRNLALTQGTDYVENDPFPANSHEDGLDRLTMITQGIQEELDRAIKASKTNTISSVDFTESAADRANKVFAFDGSGDISITQEIGTYEGDWAASTTYAERDLVKDTSTNNIFICVTAHTSSGSQPLTTNTDSAKWALIVDAASATTASTSASSSATAAAASAAAASTSASNASTSETNAATSATSSETAKTASETAQAASETAQTAAETAQAAAETAYDNFDDRYLGAKASDPATDNDGDALVDGALYFDTTNNVMKVYDLGTTTWLRTTPSSSDQTAINTVSGIAADVTTVAGVSADVTTVAGISSDVSSVAAQVVGYAFSTTTTMADPGSGNVRFNNATVSSVTAIAIDDLDSNGVDQSAYIALWDDSTNTIKGTLVFRTSGNDVATFSITGLTDNAGWFELAVTHVASSGTFSNGEDTYIGFTRAGDKGADGAGSGDVSGPGASVTDNAVVRWDTTSGQLVQNSSVIVDDSGNLQTVGGFAAQGTGLPASGSGVEVNFGLVAGEGTVQAFDRSGSAWEQLRLRGNQVAFDISGTEKMRIDSSGNVGIGTTTPAHPLTVTASGATSTFSVNPSSDLTVIGTAQSSATNSDLYIDTKGTGQSIFRQAAGTTERMRIDSSGNVGIGTSSPSAKLHVESASSGVTPNTTGDELFVEGSGNSGITIGSGSSSNGRIYFGDSGSAVIGRIGYDHTDNHMYFGTNGTAERMIIDSSGNVGIGTSSPDGWLHVDKNTAGGWPIVLENGTAAQKYAFNVTDDSSLQFYDLTATSERMRITDGGRLGIGTSAPGAALEVENSAALNAFIVDQNGASNGIYVQNAAQSNVGLLVEMSNASFASQGAQITAARAATNAYNFLIAYSSNGSDLEFRFSGDGNGTCDGSFSGGGADYAEYFESTDGTAIAVGTPVVLDSGKVRAATAADDPDDIIGVVRPPGTSAAIGNGADLKWHGQYQRDEHGAPLWEEYEVIEWKDFIYVEDSNNPDEHLPKMQGGEHQFKQRSYAVDNIPEGVTPPDDAQRTTQMRKKISPEYDSSQPYVARQDRAEWNLIGLLGQVTILKGALVNPRWRLMGEYSDTTDLWFVR